MVKRMADHKWLVEQCRKHDFDLKDVVHDLDTSTIFTASRRSDSRDACVKIMKDPQHEIQKYQREVYILRRLKHENIIELFSNFMLADKTPCLAMELSDIGDLSMYQMNQPEQRIYAAERQSITRQLLSALQYIHGRHIIHGDIKPENVLVFHGVRVKLCDFDLAREFIPGTPLSGVMGTYEFLAPEVYGDQTYQAEPVDMYSLGILHYEMVHGDVPAVQPAEDLRLFRQSLANLKDSDGLEWLFIARLADPDPTRRITLSRALKHPYFWSDQQLHAAMSSRNCNSSLSKFLAMQ